MTDDAGLTSESVPSQPTQQNQPSQPGRPSRLGERYELGEVIGRGGMAEVFAGHDDRLGRRVAIKLLRVDLARDPSFQARFRREAQASASLNHPNIVAVYDTGETDIHGVAVPYIVMEFVDGTTLRDLLRSSHRFQPERALEITEETLAALDYSHRHGIIHRDIKPGNVMLTRAGQVKVMDFGIARAIADSAATMTQTSAVLGTAQYLSPEQARGEVVDARSDLYSAGCLLYELLTARPPFVGDSPVSVAYQHVRETAPPPSTLNPDVPPTYDAVVMRALAKRADDRYQTAAEMRADAERARLGETTLAASAPTLAIAAAGVGAPGETTQLMSPVGSTTGVLPPVGKRPAQSRTGWYVLLGLCAVAALILAFFLGRNLFAGNAANISVPDVTGMTTAQATVQLQNHGLKLGNVKQIASTAPVGTVVSEQPTANTKVTRGTAVTLTVSSGPGNVVVPQLQGLTATQAAAALQAAGLTAGSTSSVNSAQPQGVVISSTPASGTSVTKGSTVALVVSSGKVGVPNVVGESATQAQADLQNAGFVPTSQTQQTAAAPAGTVIAQSPKAGSPLQPGGIVVITIAAAPPSPTNTPTGTPTATPTGTPTGTASP